MLKALLITLLLALPSGAQQPGADGGGIAARFERAAELQRRGELKEAEAEYKALIAFAPQLAEAHANLGAVLARRGQYQDAVSAYEMALRLSPQLTPVWLNLGIAHYRQARFTDAVKAFKRFLDKAPDNVQAHQLLGISLVELGRPVEAVKHLEFALRAVPDEPAVIYNLGLAYLSLRRSDYRTMIDRLASFSTGLPMAHLLRGQVLLASSQYEPAAAELEKALKLNNRLPLLRYSLGLSYLWMGRYQESITNFESELSQSPQHFPTLFYLAYLEETRGDLDKAQQHIEDALKLEPQSAEANSLLGKILVKQNRVAEAVTPLETAVANDPLDSTKRYLLARAYQQLRRHKDAAREFTEVRRLKAQKLEAEKPRIPKP